MKHKSGFVNIIGNPNVGKSTLLNALICEKLSIVTNKVQTTRHRIIGILNDDNCQIVFSDTPGIIKPSYKLQESMMNYVRSTFLDSDVIILLNEIGKNKLKDEVIYKRLINCNVPLLILLNKIDLVEQDYVNNQIIIWRKSFPNAEVIPISALNKFNLDYVIKKIKELLPNNPPYYPKNVYTDKSERFIIEEIIREKILIHYKKEIPYSVQVKIEEFNNEKNIVKIRAIIYVIRESQKGIIIGHKGLGIKRIGTESRKDIERLLNKKVYLETPIKVKKNWRDDKNQLRKFGYE